MLDQSVLINLSSSGIISSNISQLRQEYQANQRMFQAQPTLIQQYLGTQAASLAEAVVQGLLQVSFSLPDRVLLPNQGMDAKPMQIPAEDREQVLGGLMGRLIGTDLRTALRSRFLELENSTSLALSTGAILLRYAVVMHMTHNMLPSGKAVQYAADNGDEIPNIPMMSDSLPGSAFTAVTDAAVVEEDRGETGRGELLVPYVEAARRFYLPQWVAFDDNKNLLVGDLNEAKADIISMQHYLSILHAAVALAPYMVADEEYQRKRYGILGQLVNQGRALANYQVEEIIRTIKRRATSHDLDRGLSLSLPYFNDQTLMVDEFHFEVIPAGRVMFVPAFVVLAVQAQGAKVAQDTRLNHSTRRHLLMELSKLEKTFLR
jgi:hypothetical protein